MPGIGEMFPDDTENSLMMEGRKKMTSEEIKIMGSLAQSMSMDANLLLQYVEKGYLDKAHELTAHTMKASAGELLSLHNDLVSCKNAAINQMFGVQVQEPKFRP